jgi:hypothetical protein
LQCNEKRAVQTNLRKLAMQIKLAKKAKRIAQVALTLAAVAVPGAAALAQFGAAGQPVPYTTPHLNPSVPYTVPAAPEVPVSPTTPGTLPGTLPGADAMPRVGGAGCQPPGTTDLTGQNPVGAPPNNSVYAGCPKQTPKQIHSGRRSRRIRHHRNATDGVRETP